MANLGRYVIDNPEPPGALEQLSGNMNMLGQMYLKKKMAEQQRQQEMADQIKLLEEKARIENQFNPMARLGEAGKGIENLNTLYGVSQDPRFADMAKQVAGNFLGGSQNRISQPSMGQGINLPQTPQINTNQPVQIKASPQPVFNPTQQTPGSLIEESVSSKPGMFGTTEDTIKYMNPEADLMKKRMETKSDLEKTGLVSMSNLETIGTAAKDMLSVLNQAIEEGGAGGRIQSTISGGAEWIGDLPSFMGGKEIGGKFPASGAFPGKKTELLLKMMPMLTQQATKPEGSVRLIESVLRSLGATLPDKNTSRTQAGRMTAESILSFYRFARSTQMTGQDFDTVFGNTDLSSMSDKEIDAIANSWVQNVNRVSGRLDIQGEEKGAVNSLIQNIISPLGSDNKMLPTFLQGGQQPQQPVFGQQQTGKYQVGQVISLPDGRKARIIGGDMNDPDVELIQ